MPFMLNYYDKPDKLYLIYPFIIVTFLFVVVFIFALLSKIKKHITLIEPLYLFPLYFLFMILNTPTTNSQIVSYHIFNFTFSDNN